MSDSDIPAIPNVPEALREAAQLGKLIPFVGAGASCLAGCPNWTEFANGVLGHFIEQGKFSYAQLAQIESLAPRVKLSIALELRDELGVRLDFRTLSTQGPALSTQKVGDSMEVFPGSERPS